MGSLSSFDNPQKLIDRANRAVTNADSAFGAWLKDKGNLANVIEVDAQTGEKVRKVVVRVPVPDAVEEEITNAINNARNAFDQILFAACAAIGKPVKDGHYPWVTDPDDLERKFKHVKTGKELIPSELWDVFRAQQPYPASEGHSGGDTYVRTMATFANRKHTIGIEVGCSLSSVTFHGGVIDADTKGITFGPARFDPDSQEIFLYRWRGDHPKLNKEPDLTLYIAFDATAPEILRTRTAVDGVMLFIEAAQRALDALKGRAIQLGAT